MKKPVRVNLMVYIYDSKDETDSDNDFIQRQRILD